MRKIIDSGFIAMLETHDLNIRKSMNGLFGGNRRSDVYGSSAEFADYREYAPGDDLRRIDWNLYARFEKLYMKLFTDERQLHHRIYMDTSASMDWGEPNKGVTALKLAAALGYLAVQAMDRVSFYAVSGDTCRDLCRTVGSRESFYNGANILNTVEFGGEADMGKALTAMEDAQSGDGIAVLISDFLTDTRWEDGVDHLVMGGKQVHLLQVLSRDEITPDISGRVQMIDSEAAGEEDRRNYRTDVTRSAVKAYGDALALRREEMHRFCAARGVGITTVCSDESMEKILFDRATEGGLIL